MVFLPKLFPVILLRTAGGPHTDLLPLELSETAATIADRICLQESAAEFASAITSGLYEIIPTVTDSASRRLLIDVRRNAHNNRPLPRISPNIYKALPQALQHAVDEYTQLQTKVRSLDKLAEQNYLKEVKNAKRAFRALLRQNTSFQNGLLLSSSTIAPSLKKYLDSVTDQKAAITKKERSFMEYLSRMYTKPSPFSSFTHLSVGTISRRTQNDKIIFFENFDIKSRVQLNHELYKYIYGLLMRQPEAKRLLPISPNPTIKRKDGAYSFLTNHDNLEAFQRIDVTPALDVFYTLAAKAPRPLSYQELADLIVSRKYIKASPSEVTQYIDELIELGFFELRLGVSGIDKEWDKKLVQLLTPLTDNWPPFAGVAQGLARIRSLASSYGDAPTTKRRQLLEEAFEEFKTASKLLGGRLEKSEKQPAQEETQQNDKIFRHVHSADFKFHPHRLWYEDTALRAQPKISPRIRHGLELLGDLLARVESFDGCQREQERMAFFFKSKYGEDAVVDLLQFYKDYLHAKDELEKRDIPATTKREQSNKKALGIFLKNIDKPLNTDEVAFGRQTTKHLKPTKHVASFAAFLHAYCADEDIRLVLNSTAAGYGKMFSRFLYLFDDKLTAQLRQRNRAPEDMLYAEVTDASFFNANLHPRIMPYEIITPGGHPALPASAHLYAHHLEISYNESEARLILRHRPTGKEVKVFDLGLQGQKGRSMLYSLLGSFGLSPHHNANALSHHINEHVKNTASAQDSIEILPRIIYENCIVLQRKSWHVPKTQLPIRNTAESDYTYFMRVQRWRHDYGIPKEVFVRGARRKPQYISFNDPFLVAIFESCVRNCNDMLRIEEMLPNSKQVTETQGRVVEFLAQWEM